jgi:ribose transport system permease protein
MITTKGQVTSKTRRSLEVLIMPLFLAFLAMIFTLIEPRFLTGSNLSNLLRQSAILALAAFAQTLVIVSGGIDLSTGANAALVTMITAMVSKAYGIPLGFSAGLLLGSFLGLINGVLVAYFNIPPFIATVGMFIYARSFAWYIGGGLPIELMPPGYEFLGSGYIVGIPMSIIVVLAFLPIVHFLLSNTQFGRYLYAIGGNENASHLSGVRVKRYRMLAYVLSGFLAGVTGLVLTSRVISGQPGIATGLEFQAIAAVAIGGVSLGGGEGNVFRAMIGTLIMSTISNGLNLANVSSYYQQIALGIIMVLAVAIDNIQRGRLNLPLIHSR